MSLSGQPSTRALSSGRCRFSRNLRRRTSAAANLTRRAPSSEAPDFLAQTPLPRFTEFERVQQPRRRGLRRDVRPCLLLPVLATDESWGARSVDYAEEIRSARAMFTDPTTTVIELRLVQDDVQPASSGDAVPIDLDGVWKVTAAVFLRST